MLLFQVGCCYNSSMNLYFIASPTSIRYSSDLLNWTSVTTNYSQQRARLFNTGSYVIKCSEMNVEYTTNRSTWSMLTGVSSQEFGSVITSIPIVNWQNKVLALNSLSDCVIDSNLSTKSIITYDTVTSKWINSNNIPISGVTNYWNIMNKGITNVSSPYNMVVLSKVNIDNTGQVILYSITGNDFQIYNANLRLHTASNGANKWDINVNSSNTLAFNPDYLDRVTFDRSGNISSRSLNVSNMLCVSSMLYD